jgi:hypothetical protein
MYEISSGWAAFNNQFVLPGRDPLSVGDREAEVVLERFLCTPARAGLSFVNVPSIKIDS